MNQVQKFIDNYQKEHPDATVEQIACLCEMSKSNLNNIKAGKGGLNEKNMKKMSEVLNCYPSELLDPEWIKPSSLKEFEYLLQDILPAIVKFYTKYGVDKKISEEELTTAAIKVLKDVESEGINPTSDIIYFNLIQKFKNK